MTRFISSSMVKNGDGTYRVNLPEIEEKISKADLDSGEKQKVLEYARKVQSRNLQFAYKYGVLVKMDCGCWEYLQMPFWTKEEETELTKGRCTRCTGGFNFLEL